MNEQIVLLLMVCGGFVVAFVCLLCATPRNRSWRGRWILTIIAFLALLLQKGCFIFMDAVGGGGMGAGAGGPRLDGVVFVAAVVAFLWSVVILGGSPRHKAHNARTVKSPDLKYGATCNIRGSLVRSYLADTKKKVVVSIFALSSDAKERVESENKEEESGTASTKMLFRKEYRVKGSDLCWSAEWGEQNELAIVFYDYGSGVEIPYRSLDVAQKRFLRTINYQLDPALGIYKEEPSK